MAELTPCARHLLAKLDRVAGMDCHGASDSLALIVEKGTVQGGRVFDDNPALHSCQHERQHICGLTVSALTCRPSSRQIWAWTRDMTAQSKKALLALAAKFFWSFFEARPIVTDGFLWLRLSWRTG